MPQRKEVKNLLVPVCVSSSHIAYGSIRMEPEFMILGQSAATAACQAIDQNVAVQDVDAGKLRERLIADKQVLAYTGPTSTKGIDPKRLAGLVVDDTQAQRHGSWLPSTSLSGFVGTSYLHDNNESKGKCSVVFPIEVKQSGRYEVRLAYTPNPNRATNVPVTITNGSTKSTVRVNQQKPPPVNDTFVSLGTFAWDAADKVSVEVSNTDTDGYVIADAVQVIRIEK